MRLTTDLPPAAHRDYISTRRQGSAFWRLIHWGGSLQLAMVLLLTIALACAVATITESHFNGAVARHYIYKAPWFLLWLAVLAFNLFCVTLTRWPWRREHLGFVITHYGIITLLAGAVVGRLLGFEGFMNLQEGQPPERRAVLNESVAEVRAPLSGRLYEVPIDADIHRPTPSKPWNLPVPETGGSLILRFDDYHATMQSQLHAVLLENGKPVGDGQWIPSGESVVFRPATGTRLLVAFGLKTRPLPFGVTLLRFEVPRDEGTITPADFISTLRFDGPGRSAIGQAHMNYPASFPGGLWRSMLGWNYKFSQSSWNPLDLHQATLQILYDPGWPLKWIGSLLIVTGVTLLFYFRPKTE